jgi:alpha-1,2-mannosyltransferase
VRRTIPWVAALAALILASIRWIDPQYWNVVDLLDFIEGGRSVLNEGDVYRHIPGIEPFNYPPFAAVMFVPLALAGNGTATWIATGVSLASAVAAIALSLRETDAGRDSRLGWAVCLGLLVFGLESTQRTLIYGQVNLILMAFVMVDLLLVPRRYQGVLIGVAAGIKLVPVIFLFHFLLRRERAALVRVVLTGLFTVVAGWIASPTSSARYWLSDQDKVSRFGPVADDAGNQSLWAMALRVGFPAHAVVPLVAGALGIAAAVWVARRAVAAGRNLEAVCCLAVGGLLASPISWTHHWVWVLPLLVAMGARGWRVGVGLTVLIMFLPPMWLVPNDPGAGYNVGEALVASSYTLAALAFLVMLARALGRPAD